MKKLMILGSAPGYSEKINYTDYDVWGLATNLDWENMPNFDLVFEMHQNIKGELDYLHDLIRKNPKNKYIVLQRIQGLKKQILYPERDIRNKYGDYICSSFVWLLLLAVERGYTEIGFQGLNYNLLDSFRESCIERANLEYWIGYFRGKGLKINTNKCPFLVRSWKTYGPEYISKDKKYLEDQQNEMYREIADMNADEKKYDKIKSIIQKIIVYERMISFM